MPALPPAILADSPDETYNAGQVAAGLQPMSLEVGSRLENYDVTALIGEGGMGQVYQATDTKLNRP